MNYSDDFLRSAIDKVATIAVLGAKRDGPAFYVPEYLHEEGLKIFPVSPNGGEILGRAVLGSLKELQDSVDAVLIFRRSEAVPQHLPEILAMDPLPKVVWLQVGVQHEQAAEELSNAGIQVVQNRCLMVEHRRLINS